MNVAGARRIAQRLIIYAAAIVFVAAVIHRFHALGGPYFEVPETVQDHVAPHRYLSGDAIVLCRRVEHLLPRGASVTLLAPAEAPNYDQTHWLTGLGMLPYQRVVAPKIEGAPPEQWPDYVIAIRAPFTHPAYRRIASFPEGSLYEIKR
jgi:hypothetical protein